MGPTPRPCTFAPSWFFLGGARAIGADKVAIIVYEQRSWRPRCFAWEIYWIYWSGSPAVQEPRCYPLSFVVVEILALTLLNVSHAAHIWKLTFYVAHLEKNKGFLRTEVVIIKTQPRKDSQYLKFARKQKLSYSFGSSLAEPLVTSPFRSCHEIVRVHFSSK